MIVINLVLLLFLTSCSGTSLKRLEKPGQRIFPTSKMNSLSISRKSRGPSSVGGGPSLRPQYINAIRDAFENEKFYDMPWDYLEFHFTQFDLKDSKSCSFGQRFCVNEEEATNEKNFKRALDNKAGVLKHSFGHSKELIKKKFLKILGQAKGVQIISNTYFQIIDQSGISWFFNLSVPMEANPVGRSTPDSLQKSGIQNYQMTSYGVDKDSSNKIDKKSEQNPSYIAKN